MVASLSPGMKGLDPLEECDVYAVRHPCAGGAGTHWFWLFARPDTPWDSEVSQCVTNTNAGLALLHMCSQYTLQLRTWREHRDNFGNHRAGEARAVLVAQRWAGGPLAVLSAMDAQLGRYHYRPGKTCKSIITRCVALYGWREPPYCCGPQGQCGCWVLCHHFPDCAC